METDRDSAVPWSVVYACGEIVVSDTLEKYVPQPAFFAVGAGASFDEPARITLGENGRQTAATGQMMVIDRGIMQGVQRGQRLTIFRRAPGSYDTNIAIGDGVIIAVRADSATMRIDTRRTRSRSATWWRCYWRITGRSFTAVIGRGFRARQLNGLRAHGSELTVPDKVTTVPFVSTSIDRALTVSSSAIFDLIFAVSAPSLSACSAFAAPVATVSPILAPVSRAFWVLTVGVVWVADTGVSTPLSANRYPRKNAAATARITTTSTSFTAEIMNVFPAISSIARATADTDEIVIGLVFDRTGTGAERFMLR